MQIKISENFVDKLFEDNLFHKAIQSLEGIDTIYERKFSFSGKYKIGFCTDFKNLGGLFEKTIGNGLVDKLVLNGDFPMIENKDFDEHIDLYGSKIELFTKRMYQSLESNVLWDYEFNEIAKKDGDGEAFINLVKRSSNKIAELILQNDENIYLIEWREFEKLFKDIFNELGIKAKLTPGSKDGGKDLIWEIPLSNKVYYIELKHQKTPIPNDPIKKLKKTIEADSKKNTKIIYNGLIISTRGFTNNVRIVHEKDDILLGGMKKIKSLCRRFVASKNGLYLPNKDFIDILKEDTF